MDRMKTIGVFSLLLFCASSLQARVGCAIILPSIGAHPAIVDSTKEWEKEWDSIQSGRLWHAKAFATVATDTAGEVVQVENTDYFGRNLSDSLLDTAARIAIMRLKWLPSARSRRDTVMTRRLTFIRVDSLKLKRIDSLTDTRFTERLCTIDPSYPSVVLNVEQPVSHIVRAFVRYHRDQVRPSSESMWTEVIPPTDSLVRGNGLLPPLLISLDIPPIAGIRLPAYNVDELVANLTYPEMALDYKIEGTVRALLLLDAEGRALGVQIIRRVDPFLDIAAIRGIMNTTFTPTLLDGRPIPSSLVLTIRFRIERLDKP